MTVVNVKLDPDRMPTVLTMGFGAVITGTAVDEGMPALVLCPAVKPGMIDADASDQVSGRPLPENAVVIRCANAEAVFAHLHLVEVMMREFERTKVPLNPFTGVEPSDR